MDFQKLASDELIEQITKNLQGNGFFVEVVESASEAKNSVEKFLIDGSEVMTMTSVTLDQTGISDLVNNSGKYKSSRNRLNNDQTLDSKSKKSIGYASDFTIGSIHAITKSGELVIASNTGSQLGSYVYGADKVIFVVGIQKIVNGDLSEALKRIYEYVLPLESERAKKAYGVEGSNVSKILIINKEIQPNRIHIVLVKEELGF